MYTGGTSQANALPSALSILKYFSEKSKVAVAENKTWIITLPAEQYLAPKFNKAHWTFFDQAYIESWREDRGPGPPPNIQTSSTNNCINSDSRGRVMPTSVYYEL